MISVASSWGCVSSSPIHVSSGSVGMRSGKYSPLSGGSPLEDGFVEGRRDVLVVGAVELHGGQASMMRAPWAAILPTCTWWSIPCWRKTVEMAWPMALAVSWSKLIQ